MKAEDIRRRLAELALDTNEYRINAGGAMVLHGLREETHDLDIWCTKKLGDALAQRCDVQVLPDGTRRFVPAPDVEIYENMLPGETVFLNGIPVAPLEDVLALKRQLNREKDRRDIAVLEAAIAARRAAVTLAPIAPEDIAACTELYNYYIENTCITLEEEPVTPEEFGARRRRKAHRLRLSRRVQPPQRLPLHRRSLRRLTRAHAVLPGGNALIRRQSP